MKQIFVARAGFAKREAIDAYEAGALAIHRAMSNEKKWIVTHPESGCSVTGGRHFDSKAQAKRFADELQRHLDFAGLQQDANGKWDVIGAFGDRIRPAMSAAFQHAYGA